MRTALTEPKDKIARAFGQAAPRYEAVARLQRQVARTLAEFVAELGVTSNATVLEIGCGTGLMARLLAPKISPASWLATDIAPAMVETARRRMPLGLPTHNLVMDGERPATAEAAFDLICSSLTVQWFEDLAGSLGSLSRSLRPGGWLVFSTLAAGSFAEWRAACAAMGCSTGIRLYLDIVALKAALPRVGQVTIQPVTLDYPSAAAFLAELKLLGTGTPLPGYTPLSAGQLRRVLRQHAEGFSVTYHVAYCAVQAPGASRTDR